MTVIVLLLAATLGTLSLIHCYWLAGGSRGLAVAVPTIGGEPAFRPSAVATGSVAVALALAAVIPVLTVFQVPEGALAEWLHWANLLLSGVFLLRFVGDFRLVGLFKRVRGTAFADRDTWLYSPLCLLLGIGYFLVWRG